MAPCGLRPPSSYRQIEIASLTEALEAAPGDLLLLVADANRQRRPQCSGNCGWTWAKPEGHDELRVPLGDRLPRV